MVSVLRLPGDQALIACPAGCRECRSRFSLPCVAASGPRPTAVAAADMVVAGAMEAATEVRDRPLGSASSAMCHPKSRLLPRALLLSFANPDTIHSAQ
jgi:hypothetical protein